MTENQQLLESLTNRPAAVEWFRGLFHTVHLQLTDTNETFTVVHHGNRVEVTPGLGADRPNFVAPLESQNLRNLDGFFASGSISPYEEYRIVKFMLRPCLRAGLDMPILRNKAFTAVLRVDTHWQEAILDPDGNEDEQLTIVYVNDQWLIVPGYHGRPQRRLVMQPSQVLEYQRRVFTASEQNSLPQWLEVARWYLSWRDQVTVPVP